MNFAQTWKAALGELELSISKANFTTWFRQTSIKELTNNKLIILVPSEFAKDWLKNKYQKEIFKAVNNVTDNQIKKIDYFIGSAEEINKKLAELESVPKTETENQTVKEEYTPTLRQCKNGSTADESTGLNSRYHFKNFVVGSSNELAKAACQAVAENPGHDYNPLFIYGGVGLGKTHLIQAVGNKICGDDPKKNVLYVSSEKFTKSFINSLQNQSIKDFTNQYENIDILIIDDIQFLSGKTRTQEQFFYIFNDLFQSGKQIILSSDRPPNSIATLEDRLRSRFAGGMVADIGTPDFETRAAIIKTKSRERKLQMSEEVVELIAQSEQSNIRELEGNLKRVMAYCELKNCAPTKELVLTVLQTTQNNQRQKAITVEQVIEAVGSFYGVDNKALKGNSRKKDVVRPRQIAMFLMRDEIKTSFPSIGDNVGGRDHTTAMHAFEKIKTEIEVNEVLKQEIELLRQRLYL